MKNDKEVAFVAGYVRELWSHVVESGRLEFLRDIDFEGSDPVIVYKDWQELSDDERRGIIASILLKPNPAEYVRFWNRSYLRNVGASGYRIPIV